ncbi:MAG: TIGR04282 family arsenosugar biosynthesis glycosyltransferase [Hyphomonadaceae bacterium]|nr:TIGR04282 family arsenosugar biosynthesis glycosyltransferase [Hyphomonadaceae bacterium]
MTRTLIVMAKTPRVGQGKSRLARAAGMATAWRVNRALNARTLRVARDPRWRTVIAVSPDRDVRVRLPGVWPPDVDRRPQGRGDLGVRLARALCAARGAVAVIGTDCPEITRADIAAAFGLLRRAPVVVGPAADGGFWILAAREGRAVARAFHGVRWSSAHTLSDLEARLHRRPARLRVRADIDTLEDWRAWRARRRADQRAP